MAAVTDLDYIPVRDQPDLVAGCLYAWKTGHGELLGASVLIAGALVFADGDGVPFLLRLRSQAMEHACEWPLVSDACENRASG